MHAKSLRLCPTVYDPMDFKLARHSCPWASPGKNTGVGCHALLQGVFLTQGSNPRSLTVSCFGSQILYHCRHLGSPFKYPFSLLLITGY